MGIPFKYGFRVFGISRYPPGIPRTLVIWVPPLQMRAEFREHLLKYILSSKRFNCCVIMEWAKFHPMLAEEVG